MANLIPFAFESVTVSTSAVGLTSATYAPAGEQAAVEAFVTVETAAIAYLFDGTTPTVGATILGHQASSTASFRIRSASDIQNFLAIRTGGSDATIRVTYFR